MYINIELLYNSELNESPFLIHEEDYNEFMEYLNEYLQKCEKTGYDFMFYEIEEYINSKGINTIRETKTIIIQTNINHIDYKGDSND